MASKFSKNQTVIYKDSEGYQKGTVITVLGEDRYEIQPSHIPYAMTRKMWDEELMSEAEYEAMTPANTGSAMLKDFEDAPAAKPTTESSIALLKDFDEEATPAANTETVSAKAVKLSAAQQSAFKTIVDNPISHDYTSNNEHSIWGVHKARVSELSQKGFIRVTDKVMRRRCTLTKQGIAYATEHGWLTAPANSEPQADNDDDEPIVLSDEQKDDLATRFAAFKKERAEAKIAATTQADITPADRAAAESMGEVAANVFGEETPKKVFHVDGMVYVAKDNGNIAYCIVRELEGDMYELEDANYNIILAHKRATFATLDEAVDYRNQRDAHVMDVPASDEIASEDAQPEGALTDDERAVLEYVCSVFGVTFSQIWAKTGLSHPATKKAIESLMSRKLLCKRVDIYNHTSSGRAALAQPAPVDGGSDEPLHVTIMNQLDAKVEDLTDEIEHQQTEIRTLESKLAAAAAALEAIANLQLLDGWKLIDARIKARETLAKLAVLQQSGAGEGK